MSRTKKQHQLIEELIQQFLKLPRAWQLTLGVGAVIVSLLYLAGAFKKREPNTPIGEIGTTPVSAELQDGTRELFFAFWNVENFFDDKNDDEKRRSVDKQYDTPFADNAQLRQLKLDRLTETIMKMNGGKGPDILAVCEVESVRALELLQGALNRNVQDPKQRYVSYAMKNLDAGRHIAPGVISRLPLSQISTRLHGSRLRILETRLIVNGHPLVIVASHWTSKLSQGNGGNGEEGREKYARTIYGVYKNLADKNPDADFLLCGDFNDTPESEEVTLDLNAIGDIRKVKSGDGVPKLLDLFAGKPADRFGTIWYSGKPYIYDHIVVSRGMLDALGWSCDPASAATITDGLIRKGATRREPWRFGDPDRELRDSERGFSDHFPVTAKLRVAPPAMKNSE
jgi:endonuclease/exonuclease/phosphatase family metal-dependent hydrolase